MTIFPQLDTAFPNKIISAGSAFNNVGFKIPGRSDTPEKVEFLNQFKFTKDVFILLLVIHFPVDDFIISIVG